VPLYDVAERDDLDDRRSPFPVHIGSEAQRQIRWIHRLSEHSRRGTTRSRTIVSSNSLSYAGSLEEQRTGIGLLDYIEPVADMTSCVRGSPRLFQQIQQATQRFLRTDLAQEPAIELTIGFMNR
jgi:hypothetical protein